MKHESLSSFELLVNHRGWKETEGSDSDVEYISETKIMKKSGQKKVKPQQQRYPAVPLENVKLASIDKVIFFVVTFSQKCVVIHFSRDNIF